MKKILLLLLLTVTSFTVCAQDVKTFVPSNYVSDLGDLYTTEQEAKLNSIISDYEKKTSIEIAIITVESLNGESIEDFASYQFRRIGIGKKGADNGILIVFSKNDRKSRIETGNGMEPFFSDVNSYDALEVIKPYFRKGDYSTGTLECVSFIINKLGNKSFENKVLWLKQQKAKEAKETAASIEAFKNFVIKTTLVLSFFGILFFIYYLDKKRREKIAAEKEAIRLEKLRVALLLEDIEKEKNSIKKLVNYNYSTKLVNSNIVMSSLDTLKKYISTVDITKITGTNEEILTELKNLKYKLNSKITAFDKIVKEVSDDISSLNYQSIVIDDLFGYNTKAISDLVKIKSYGYSISYSDQSFAIKELFDTNEKIKELLNTDIDTAISKGKSIKRSIDYIKSNSDEVRNYLNKIVGAENKVINSDREVNNILTNIKRYESYLKPNEYDRALTEYREYKRKESTDFLSSALLLGALLISLNRLYSTVKGRKDAEDAEIRRIEEAKRRKKQEEERRKRQEEEEEDRRRRNSYSSSSSYGSSYGSSDSGSSFGGFGGGDSSGGGSSSGW